MKAFHWETDVSIENMHQGFTHVFVSTFESTWEEQLKIVACEKKKK
ncbi:Stress-response A/B barrel domain-containing protein HS1 [Linum perenne]